MHALTIVEYDYDSKSKNYYWIIRNSYGTSWGENGYFRVAAGYNICSIKKKAYYFDIYWACYCGEGCDKCIYETDHLKYLNCINGYLFTGNICLKCINGCKNWKDQISCTVCNDGYCLKNNRCEKCVKDCKKCRGNTEKDCCEWYFGNFLNEGEDSFLDEERKEKCSCIADYLSGLISLLILSLLY